VDRNGAQAQPTDPGAIALNNPVRDLDVVPAPEKKRGAPILSPSGAPERIVTPSGTQRALVVRDPDGYLAWAIEVPPADATSPGMIQPGVSMALSVKDMAATARFYRGIGLDLTGSMKFKHERRWRTYWAFRRRASIARCPRRFRARAIRASRSTSGKACRARRSI
jgi:hypothetical protein